LMEINKGCRLKRGSIKRIHCNAFFLHCWKFKV
jgi:hypothetical protein